MTAHLLMVAVVFAVAHRMAAVAFEGHLQMVAVVFVNLFERRDS
jgi:hypothetical protein